MNRPATFWLIAFIITALTAYYQRVSGPTYAMSGTVTFRGKELAYTLDRSHGGPTNAVVRIPVNDSSIHGVIEWKRYKTNDEWTQTAMIDSAGVLTAELPHQPPAGKLLYRVVLDDQVEKIVLPETDPVVIRFKGDVPLAVLIPHILAMFGAMLLSARAGLEVFSTTPKFKSLIQWTMAFFFVGGIILGPIVQKYAFDAFWTGWPFGSDLTDNKTAVALLAWGIAAIGIRRSQRPKRWVLGAAFVTFIVFLIPHSMFGSELDYNSPTKQPTGLNIIRPRPDNWVAKPSEGLCWVIQTSRRNDLRKLSAHKNLLYLGKWRFESFRKFTV